MEMATKEIWRRIRLIAEFMGYTYNDQWFLEPVFLRKFKPHCKVDLTSDNVNDYDSMKMECKEYSDLPYFRSWNLLMPVVEKINTLHIDDSIMEQAKKQQNIRNLSSCLCCRR